MNPDQPMSMQTGAQPPPPPPSQLTSHAMAMATATPTSCPGSGTGSVGLTGSTTTTGMHYGGGGVIGGVPTSGTGNTAGSYVSIGILPSMPPAQLAPLLLPGPPTATTTTFKTTPLLPMPTLEDIEVAANQGGGAPGGQVVVSLAQPSLAPPGILKYPTASGYVSDLMAPPPNLQSLQQQLPLTLPLPMPLPPPLASGSCSNNSSSSSSNSTAGVGIGGGNNSSSNNNSGSNCGTLKSNAKLLPLQLLSSSSSSTPPNRKEPLPPAHPQAASIQAQAQVQHQLQQQHQQQQQQQHQQQQQQRQRKRNGWCSCFGGGGSGSGGSSSSSSGSEGKTPPGYGTKEGTKKKRKGTSQTVWSALLTNLGICMLLLAYTLLGSFIFLTIENEDSALLHQQHTLASTKRNMANTGNSIYQQQQQQQQQQHNLHQQQQQQRTPHQSTGHHGDNDTITAAVAAQGMISGTGTASGVGVGGGVGGPFGGDFVYGVEDADLDSGGMPQFALSPDTYDVRQRTIENIWDITVSLNILYKENWTKLAALEIAKFQDQLIKRLNEDVMLQLSHDDVANANSNAPSSSASGSSSNNNNPATEAVLLHTHYHHHRAGGVGGVTVGGGPPHEWNFAKAFLYSLTVLTTIGYGNIAPRTTLGRIVTLAYAFFGIPLTLVYLSSTGSILARVAREVFSKALCCCLCSNCGYCCYDEKRMAEKERRMRRKRQQEELRKQQAVMQEPYYVRDVYHATPEKEAGGGDPPSAATVGGGGLGDIDSLSASESRGSMHGLSILAPILLCFSMMIIYIVFGAAVLYRLENWPILDGIYFCFMSLSTIGFGDMLPGLRRESNATTWFCSVYIMSGMTLTAMCFNVIHEEIVHRIRIVVEFKKTSAANSVAAGSGGVGGGPGGPGSSMMDVAHEEGGQYYVPAS
ncbi:uncharacterized protein [Drosophila kikkawai]|uniref:Potassium channel domain-containing protein n=1 Tax=Drosophila kikkawai TaxID=30033 RepID=A0A6P4I606_DROKI|nr:uncharacterized protein LOC108076115 [Drosophila kikkawai]XP_017024333.1 uncharacterized protein LOC108076115 [Drosophila kikkawai]